MATILLQAAGSALGGVFGTVGSAIGSAVGAMAGYAIDRALITGTQRIEGPRLSGARPFTAEEGAAIPRVYGVARMGGLIIWATRFEEAKTTTRQGFKGGPRVTEYSYFANVAFALCEGEIAGVRRIWADGKEIDQTLVEIRVHTGTETQEPDPLIAAKQGDGNAPAYRGTAYVVFDRFPLADYGNRIPQLQFEVLRPVGDFHKQVRGVALIPGATEYGLSPTLVVREVQPGESEALNRHVLFGSTNLVAALDELQMLCPNLEHIALVATWFGNDLRAGKCLIRPMVTDNALTNFSDAWIVSGVERQNAVEVSYHGKGSAYGGTPSDKSVIDAIAEIKRRGLKVTLYPFVMMDVTTDNTLADPYGGSAQAPYPWRGRITCYPGPMQTGSADKTSAARLQVEAFCGKARAQDFAAETDTIRFLGNPQEWSYRRFLLHFAHLAVAAGGVDTMLVGTEFRGLTTLRDATNAFPFVEALCTLANDVRSIVGPGVQITYGADWSEYFGHQPADGSGDVFYHLDPLWAHPEVAAVGIDNYMPLSDWRDQDYGGGNADGFATPYDLEGMVRAVAGGEGFDWYYASMEARSARDRSPITDGQGKPWVYRYKDLVSWWSNQHFNRIGGVEAGAPTVWVPRSKPLWFTELGCPSVDKGPNQPNVFPDPKSSESAAPYFSNGGRSDIAQRRFLEAHQRYWGDADAITQDAHNPRSPIYGGRMLDPGRTLIWAWDARAFPAFPLREDQWSDGANWQLGHWLNGRLDAVSCTDLITAILADHGLTDVDALYAEGMAQGYVVADPTTARAALEPVLDLYGLIAFESAGTLVFRNEAASAANAIEVAELVQEDAPTVTVERTPDHELPREAVLGLRELFLDYQQTAPRSRKFGVAGSRQQNLGFPGTIDFGQAQSLLDDWMRRIWTSRESVSFSTAPNAVMLEPGAIIRLPDAGVHSDFQIDRVEEGLHRTISARRVSRVAPMAWRGAGQTSSAAILPLLAGRPDVHFLDLPMGDSEAPAQTRFRVAAWQKPWRSQAVYASAEQTGFELRSVITTPAVIGRLTAPLASGPEGRIDRGNAIVVRLSSGELASISHLQMLNGGNAAAVRSSAGSWEIVQFEIAEEISVNVWRLTGLLRGQLGTGDAMLGGSDVGAPFVLLNDAVEPVGLTSSEIGLERRWKVGPVGYGVSSTHMLQKTEIGGLRARLPLAPAHLRARRGGGALTISWVRRARFGGDDWAPEDPPLCEAYEQYQVEIAAPGGPIVRAMTVSAPGWTYSAEEIATDFGTLPDTLDVTVRQRSAAAGWGIAASRRLSTY